MAVPTEQHHAKPFRDQSVGQVGQGDARGRDAVDQQHLGPMVRTPLVHTRRAMGAVDVSGSGEGIGRVWKRCWVLLRGLALGRGDGPWPQNGESTEG